MTTTPRIYVGTYAKYNINTILRAAPVRSSYGAPMGSQSYMDEPTEPMYLQALRMVDGDYSADGTYWGSGSRQHGYMYCAFSTSNRVYVRAVNRKAAVLAVLTDFPDSLFFRA